MLMRQRHCKSTYVRCAFLFVIMTHVYLSTLLTSTTRRSSSSTTRLLVAQAWSTTSTSTTLTRRETNPQNKLMSANSRTVSSLSSSPPSSSYYMGGNSTSRGLYAQATAAESVGRRLSSSAKPTTHGLEESDLDLALEDIFDSTMSDVQPQRLAPPREPKVVRIPPPSIERSANVEYAGTKFVSREKKIARSTPVTRDDTDYNDRELLSVTNPRWVQPGMLDPKLIDMLLGKGITHFTPVQAEAIEPVLKRRDVIGRSRTGTGKTLAFGLPTITRLVDFTIESGKRDERTGQMKRGRLPSMVVLCPTRELARQVQEELSLATKPLGLICEVFHGGVSYDPQSRALQLGIDVLVGTPGRVIDHLNQRKLDLSTCDVVVLDEADEMLNMGFAEDVEIILKNVGSDNDKKTQCLMFSATTPSWVKEIGQKYQRDVLAIDSTGNEGGARVATTVRHLAIQMPPGADAKKSVLEDIIAVEISKDNQPESKETVGAGEVVNPIAAAALAKKNKTHGAMQQRIFGKTIVFTQTKREADELVSGSVFKSLTAQALHGDVSQKQRDATLSAFRSGAFNVLVATDVAARGIDISDVDLVIQFDPPRDVDTYVHRSGRTGRAGRKGISVLLFSPNQSRDIVRIEQDLGHGFKFDLVGPPSTESALRAAAKASAVASTNIPAETAAYFKDSAAALLSSGDDPEDVIARCLAAISRRSTEVLSRSLLTGEVGFLTLEMVRDNGVRLESRDVIFAVSKLSRMSHQEEGGSFDGDVGKIQISADGDKAVFDMGMEDAKRLLELSKSVDMNGITFSILKQLAVERDALSFRSGRPGPGGKVFDRSSRFGRDDRWGGKPNGGPSSFRKSTGSYQRDTRPPRGDRPTSNYQGRSSNDQFKNRYEGRRKPETSEW